MAFWEEHSKWKEQQILRLGGNSVLGKFKGQQEVSTAGAEQTRGRVREPGAAKVKETNKVAGSPRKASTARRGLWPLL